MKLVILLNIWYCTYMMYYNPKKQGKWKTTVYKQPYQFFNEQYKIIDESGW